MIIFAGAVGYATFIEDAHDTPTAKILVYSAAWFEMLLIVLAFNLIGTLVRMNVFQKSKISILTFHLSFVLILLGAGITRFASYEGIVRVKEGEFVSTMYTAEPYLLFQFIDSKGTSSHKEQKWLSEATPRHNDFDIDFDLPQRPQLNASYNWYLTESVYDAFDGEGKGDEYVVISFTRDPQDTIYLKNGEVRMHQGMIYAFNNNEYSDAIKISNTDGGELYISAPYDITKLDQSKMKNAGSMQNPPMDTLVRDEKHRFWPRHVHFVQGRQFFYKIHYDDAVLGFRKQNKLEENQGAGVNFLCMDLSYNGEKRELILPCGENSLFPPQQVFFSDSLICSVFYGPITREMPFSVGCVDMRVKNYPGSGKASSFESDVIIDDKRDGTNFEANIFMNNVLDYKGYRFFQSSYMVSEEAQRAGTGPDITVLSVNHDFWGTWITYIGYILMALGFIWSLFDKNSRFRLLARKLKQNGAKLSAILVLLGLSSMANAQLVKDFDDDFIKKNERVLVQSYEGRISPLQTHAIDVLNKVYRKRHYKGMSATEVYLSMLANSRPWFNERIISVKTEGLKEFVGAKDGYVSLLDMLDTSFLSNGIPILKPHIDDAYDEAHKKRDINKSKFDKELIKLVDRFEVLFGVISGQYFKVFPNNNSENYEWLKKDEWLNPYQIFSTQYQGDDAPEIYKVYTSYFDGLKKGVEEGAWDEAITATEELIGFQREKASDIVPSENHVSMEILYNNLNVFFLLMMIYCTLGGFMLIFLIVWVLSGKGIWLKIIRPLFWLTIAAMAVHVFGLGLRWYISGHAPWSNGYEALVFISFATMLAGAIFYRYSRFSIAATGILAALILGVAHGSHVDPELTDLVPVLKSYWLVIHVAIITSSYGFLGLGAILALINLIFYVSASKSNKRVNATITELTHTAELTMTIGLYMAAIGTFLGGVWANESWGRYWGWDAKETWALVIVLTYAIVLHLRFIPGMKSKLTFNLFALWSYATVIMTYFGVNYYLVNGLHSYAQAGSKSVLPSWANITILILGLLTAYALIREYRHRKQLKSA